MSKKDKVIMLDFWGSPFAMRVKMALEEKGIEFEAREEGDLLRNKSELLLQSNPIYKKVPVLLHNGKPLCESLVILNYIDETWPSPPLLPTSPYERSVAKFWADFVDKKVFDGGRQIWTSEGEALEVAKKGFVESLRLLEEALGEKEFFAGEKFGFVDIVLIPHTSWFYAYEQFGGFKVEDQCPKLSAWMKRCLGRESVAKLLPDSAKVCELVCMLRKMNGIE
ncbi:Glutathione S-transferase U25 [Cocos nucifera]|uniref:Glutathione S-transferase n=1 Tax=Cocos nucifera TaxID=13894 RepID=A0A8K0IGN0_COCNU|nr:Glutathione S-transferase U25 [Cocos nucifera]